MSLPEVAGGATYGDQARKIRELEALVEQYEDTRKTQVTLVLQLSLAARDLADRLDAMARVLDGERPTS